MSPLPLLPVSTNTACREECFGWKLLKALLSLPSLPFYVCTYINTEYAPVTVAVSVSLYGCLNLILCLYVQVHHGSERTCAQGGPWLQTIGFYSTGDPLSPPLLLLPCGYMYIRIYLLFQNVYMVMQCAKEAVSFAINQSHKLKQYRHLRYKMRLQCPSVFATK